MKKRPRKLYDSDDSENESTSTKSSEKDSKNEANKLLDIKSVFQNSILNAGKILPHWNENHKIIKKTNNIINKITNTGLVFPVDNSAVSFDNWLDEYEQDHRATDLPQAVKSEPNKSETPSESMEPQPDIKDSKSAEITSKSEPSPTVEPSSEPTLSVKPESTVKSVESANESSVKCVESSKESTVKAVESKVKSVTTPKESKSETSKSSEPESVKSIIDKAFGNDKQPELFSSFNSWFSGVSSATKKAASSTMSHAAKLASNAQTLINTVPISLVNESEKQEKSADGWNEQWDDEPVLLSKKVSQQSQPPSKNKPTQDKTVSTCDLPTVTGDGWDDWKDDSSDTSKPSNSNLVTDDKLAYCEDVQDGWDNWNDDSIDIESEDKPDLKADSALQVKPGNDFPQEVCEEPLTCKKSTFCVPGVGYDHECKKPVFDSDGWDDWNSTDINLDDILPDSESPDKSGEDLKKDFVNKDHKLEDDMLNPPVISIEDNQELTDVKGNEDFDRQVSLEMSKLNDFLDKQNVELEEADSLKLPLDSRIEPLQIELDSPMGQCPELQPSPRSNPDDTCLVNQSEHMTTQDGWDDWSEDPLIEDSEPEPTSSSLTSRSKRALSPDEPQNEPQQDRPSCSTSEPDFDSWDVEELDPTIEQNSYLNFTGSAENLCDQVLGEIDENSGGDHDKYIEDVLKDKSESWLSDLIEDEQQQAKPNKQPKRQPFDPRMQFVPRNVSTFQSDMLSNMIHYFHQQWQETPDITEITDDESGFLPGNIATESTCDEVSNNSMNEESSPEKPKPEKEHPSDVSNQTLNPALQQEANVETAAESKVDSIVTETIPAAAIDMPDFASEYATSAYRKGLESGTVESLADGDAAKCPVEQSEDYPELAEVQEPPIQAKKSTFWVPGVGYDHENKKPVYDTNGWDRWNSNDYNELYEDSGPMIVDETIEECSKANAVESSPERDDLKEVQEESCACKKSTFCVPGVGYDHECKKPVFDGWEDWNEESIENVEQPVVEAIEVSKTNVESAPLNQKIDLQSEQIERRNSTSWVPGVGYDHENKVPVFDSDTWDKQSENLPADKPVVDETIQASEISNLESSPSKDLKPQEQQEEPIERRNSTSWVPGVGYDHESKQPVFDPETWDNRPSESFPVEQPAVSEPIQSSQMNAFESSSAMNVPIEANQLSDPQQQPVYYPIEPESSTYWVPGVGYDHQTGNPVFNTEDGSWNAWNLPESYVQQMAQYSQNQSMDPPTQDAWQWNQYVTYPDVMQDPYNQQGYYNTVDPNGYGNQPAPEGYWNQQYCENTAVIDTASAFGEYQNSGENISQSAYQQYSDPNNPPEMGATNWNANSISFENSQPNVGVMEGASEAEWNAWNEDVPETLQQTCVGEIQLHDSSELLGTSSENNPDLTLIANSTNELLPIADLDQQSEIIPTDKIYSLEALPNSQQLNAEDNLVEEVCEQPEQAKKELSTSNADQELAHETIECRNSTFCVPGVGYDHENKKPVFGEGWNQQAANSDEPKSEPEAKVDSTEVENMPNTDTPESNIVLKSAKLIVCDDEGWDDDDWNDQWNDETPIDPLVAEPFQTSTQANVVESAPPKDNLNLEPTTQPLERRNSTSWVPGVGYDHENKQPVFDEETWAAQNKEVVSPKQTCVEEPIQTSAKSNVVESAPPKDGSKLEPQQQEDVHQPIERRNSISWVPGVGYDHENKKPVFDSEAWDDWNDQDNILSQQSDVNEPMQASTKANVMESSPLPNYDLKPEEKDVQPMIERRNSTSWVPGVGYDHENKKPIFDDETWGAKANKVDQQSNVNEPVQESSKANVVESSPPNEDFKLQEKDVSQPIERRNSTSWVPGVGYDHENNKPVFDSETWGNWVDQSDANVEDTVQENSKANIVESLPSKPTTDDSSKDKVPKDDQKLEPQPPEHQPIERRNSTSWVPGVGYDHENKKPVFDSETWADWNDQDNGHSEQSATGEQIQASTKASVVQSSPPNKISKDLSIVDSKPKEVQEEKIGSRRSSFCLPGTCGELLKNQSEKPSAEHGWDDWDEPKIEEPADSKPIVSSLGTTKSESKKKKEKDSNPPQEEQIGSRKSSFCVPGTCDELLVDQHKKTPAGDSPSIEDLEQTVVDNLIKECAKLKVVDGSESWDDWSEEPIGDISSDNKVAKDAGKTIDNSSSQWRNDESQVSTVKGKPVSKMTSNVEQSKKTSSESKSKDKINEKKIVAKNDTVKSTAVNLPEKFSKLNLKDKRKLTKTTPNEWEDWNEDFDNAANQDSGVAMLSVSSSEKIIDQMPATATKKSEPVKKSKFNVIDSWDDSGEGRKLEQNRRKAKFNVVSEDSDWSTDWDSSKNKPQQQQQHQTYPSVSAQNIQSSSNQSPQSFSNCPNPSSSDSGWFSSFKNATKTAAVTTMTHAVKNWSFNPTNLLDSVGKYIDYNIEHH